MTALRIVIVFVLFAVFFVTSGAASPGINYTVQGCWNESQQQIVSFHDGYELKNVTTIETVACSFGCDNSTGACRNMAAITSFGWLAFSGEIMFLLFCTFMVWFWDTKKDYTAAGIFKFMFLFMGFITIWSMFSTIGTVGSSVSTVEISKTTSIMFTWANASMFITVFFLFYFMALLMINILGFLRTRKEKMQQRVIGDLGELDVK